ncbi:MAG: hypothetical protein AAGA43_15695 [Bacteroidota bacterium]
MSWGKFLGILTVLYLAWYGINLLLDSLKGRRKVATSSDTTFDLGNLIEEQAVQVEDIDVKEEVVEYKKKETA